MRSPVCVGRGTGQFRRRHSVGLLRYWSAAVLTAHLLNGRNAACSAVNAMLTRSATSTRACSNSSGLSGQASEHRWIGCTCKRLRLESQRSLHDQDPTRHRELPAHIERLPHAVHWLIIGEQEHCGTAQGCGPPGTNRVSAGPDKKRVHCWHPARPEENENYCGTARPLVLLRFAAQSTIILKEPPRRARCFIVLKRITQERLEDSRGCGWHQEKCDKQNNRQRVLQSCTGCSKVCGMDGPAAPWTTSKLPTDVSKSHKQHQDDWPSSADDESIVVRSDAGRRNECLETERGKRVD
eukprot:1775661-Prymnesium_polylepis.2